MERRSAELGVDSVVLGPVAHDELPALTAGRALGPDVASTGKVFTYSTTPVEQSD